jgi:hypothetical protein
VLLKKLRFFFSAGIPVVQIEEGTSEKTFEETINELINMTIINVVKAVPTGKNYAT